MSESGYWRWNTNITWHYFSSVGISAASAREATSEFMRDHHIRTLLYFSECTIESALNSAKRNSMSGEPEEAIFRTLRWGSLRDKATKWPSEIAGREISFEPDFWQFFDHFKNVRNEVTHPKRHDHSIYADLDKADPTTIEKAIARALVTLYSAQKKPWPYWLLSWNYVGFNGDKTAPFESNNLNGFFHSLPALGIRWHGASQMCFEQEGMSTLANFDELDAVMKKVTLDIEPPNKIFTDRPRLTRRWWDLSFLQSCFGLSNK
ncbi:hypothetical protein [Rhizobium sp. L1K21]|uniref:hypothetical protein n=1 Tax=Rhizobium sp. L1K21 TaxID=2954933 RepID=UPI002092B9E5|nr:hypothetical protein [Rhizobium sp. L1K21]MCO6187215.1 hypothetical protein [Rhizobium sp. L1K21]